MTLDGIDLGVLVLSNGAHDKDAPEVCVMEACSILACAAKAEERVPTWAEALDKFRVCKTDRPVDACRVLTSYMQRLNDRLRDDERQRLKPYALRLIGTRVPIAVEIKRAYVLADAAVRIFAPLALDARGFGERAATLRAADPITDRASAYVAADAAAYAADAAAAAADAAAYAAAAYAADAAAAAADAAAYAAAAYDADVAADADAAAAADAVQRHATRSAAYSAYSAYAAYAAAYADDAAAAYSADVVDEALAAADRALAITE